MKKDIKKVEKFDFKKVLDALYLLASEINKIEHEQAAHEAIGYFGSTVGVFTASLVNEKKITMEDFAELMKGFKDIFKE